MYEHSKKMQRKLQDKQKKHYKDVSWAPHTRRSISATKKNCRPNCTLEIEQEKTIEKVKNAVIITKVHTRK